MKKKKNNSGEDSDSDETFPVDTLGIPILIEVVESAVSARLPEEEEEIETLTHSATGLGPLDSGPVSDQGNSTQLAAEVHLDQITDKIVEAVTEEILAALKPLIREKVSLALRMYEDELLKLPDEESEK